MVRQKTFASVLALIGLAVLSSTAWSGDYNWNRWKGPDQTGISQETGWDVKALNQPLKVNWRKEIGPGYSNVSIQDGYLYTMGYDKKKKRNNLYCFDAASGKEVWRHSVKAKKGTYEGPKSTPVIDDGRVYTFSQDGLVLCQDAKTGKVLWERDAVKEFGSEVLRWRISSSVLIEGDTAYLNACKSGVALDKKTGKLLWKSAPGEGNYATPISFDVDGKHLLAIYGTDHLYAVAPTNGKVLWSFPWEARYTIIASDPVVIGKRVFISTGYGVGSALVDFSSGTPKQVWRLKRTGTHFGTAILIDGYLYAVDGNAGTDASLICMKPEDGSIQWREELGFGNMMAAAGCLIFLSESGTVTVVRADPKQYVQESSKAGVIPGTCWTAPVLCNGNLYVRNEKGDLASISLAK